VTPNEEWGLVGKVAIVTGGGAKDDGIGSRGSVVQESVVEETEENWARVMHVNIDSMFLACKCAVPAMVRTGEDGSIVNISSISALRPRGLTVYTVSKGAVIALTKAIAVDHGADGIRANCLVPGAMFTPMVYSRDMTDEACETRRKASVLGREGNGWDIGRAVRFLLSDQARDITGQTLSVDGGATLVGPSRASQ
jgi:NAD(P)-dependent dehydrogenase (short-subunit alcohol dehydrogenase family)